LSIGGVWAGAAGTVPVIKAKYDIAELTGPPTSEKAVIAAFFTAKGDTLYAICPRWPQNEMVLKDIDVSSDATVTMLGVAQPLHGR